MKNLSIVFALIALVSCGDPANEETTQTAGGNNNVLTLTPEQLNNIPVTIGKVMTGDLTSTIALNGVVSVPPQNMISISMPLGGFIKECDLTEGQRIRKGETLLLLEDPQYIQIQQDYLTAVAVMEYLEKEFDRQKNLNASKAGSDKVLQQTKSDYQQQKITLKSLEEKLKFINIDGKKLNESGISGTISITSPINGFISKVNFNTGKYAGPSDVILELVNNDRMNVRLRALENDVARIQPGQAVSFFDNFSNTLYEGIVSYVNMNLDGERAATITCELKGNMDGLFPGKFLNASVTSSRSNVPALPDEAIVDYEGRSYIFSKTGQNQFLLVEIRKGISHNGITEILNSNEIGDKDVVTKGAYALLMALKNTSEE